VKRADDIWCYIRLIDAKRDAKPGDALNCTTNGVDTVATVTECPSRLTGTLNARIEGLQEHKLGKVSRDLFGSVEVEFFINRDGRACTALWWK